MRKKAQSNGKIGCDFCEKRVNDVALGAPLEPSDTRIEIGRVQHRVARARTHHKLWVNSVNDGDDDDDDDEREKNTSREKQIITKLTEICFPYFKITMRRKAAWIAAFRLKTKRMNERTGEKKIWFHLMIVRSNSPFVPISTDSVHLSRCTVHTRGHTLGHSGHNPPGKWRLLYTRTPKPERFMNRKF